MMRIKKHIEVVWSDGRKTVETYDPGITDADGCFDTLLHLIGFYEGEPVSYRELD